MNVIRKSIFTGIIRERELDITEDQVRRYHNGELIQDCFPNLNASDREFFMTGATDEEWDEYTKLEDEEEDDSKEFWEG